MRAGLTGLSLVEVLNGREKVAGPGLTGTREGAVLVDRLASRFLVG